MSVYLFVLGPSVLWVRVCPNCFRTYMRMSGFVISRQHLEGSILLRWVNWQVAFFFAMSSARHCTFWSEHKSAYCAIQTSMIKQERIKRTDFRTLYKGQTCIGIGCLPCLVTKCTCTFFVGIKFFSNGQLHCPP